MKRLLLVVVVLVVPLVLACSGSNVKAPAETKSEGNSGGITSGAMVVPNTFMTYDGRKYRLVEVLQANLLDDKAFQKVGTTQQADIEFTGSLDVFRRDGDASGRYTLSKGQGSGEAAVPATWLRWTPTN